MRYRRCPGGPGEPWWTWRTRCLVCGALSGVCRAVLVGWWLAVAGLSGRHSRWLGAVPVAMTVAVARGQRDALSQDPVEPHPQLADAAPGRGGGDLVAIRGGRFELWQPLPGLELGTQLFGWRPGLLDVLPVGQLPDNAGFDAMLEYVDVLALQAQADPFGHPVRDDRPDDDRVPRDLRGQIQGNVEEPRDDVVRALQPQDPVEGDPGHADGGSSGCVAWPVVDMVLPSIAGNPLFGKRPDGEPGYDDAEWQKGGQEHVKGKRVASDVPVPAWPNPQSSL